MGYVGSSGHVREAREDVEIDGTVGVAGLRCGENLADITRQNISPSSVEPMGDVLSICQKSWASSVFAIMRGRWCCTTPEARSQGNAQAVLLRREPVLGHQEIVLAVRNDQKDARDHELALTSPGAAARRLGGGRGHGDRTIEEASAPVGAGPAATSVSPLCP